MYTIVTPFCYNVVFQYFLFEIYNSRVVVEEYEMIILFTWNKLEINYDLERGKLTIVNIKSFPIDPSSGLIKFNIEVFNILMRFRVADCWQNTFLICSPYLLLVGHLIVTFKLNKLDRFEVPLMKIVLNSVSLNLCCVLMKYICMLFKVGTTGSGQWTYLMSVFFL